MKIILQKMLLCCLALFLVNSITAQITPGIGIGGAGQLTTHCDIDLKAYPPAGTDCVYFLQLSDTGLNGWDGASIDVSVAEAWPADHYKMSVLDGECLTIPIYVNDGETIDLTYWNGANESEHGFVLYDALGNVVSDTNGNDIDFDTTPPASTQIRAKVVCPRNSCKNGTESFTVRITMGLDPIEQSWEIYSGLSSTTSQGNQVIGVNASAYSGLAPGTRLEYPVTLDLCDVYTFVAFDANNNGWGGGTWEIITANTDYGTEITSFSDPLFGQSIVLTGPNAFPDEDRVQFTLPCNPGCAPVNISNASVVDCEATGVSLPVVAPEICYPNCYHASDPNCTGIKVQHTVLVNGVDYAELPGTEIDYMGETSILFGDLPTGCHKYVTQYTYCDGIIVKCTTDLNIVTSQNPVPVCNDNLHLSLGTPDDNDNNFTGGLADDLGECVVQVLPDMVLEMPGNNCPGAFNEYTVTILGANGQPLVVYGENGLPLDVNGNYILPGSNTTPANNLVGPAQLMQTLTYVVTHKFSNNKCWGTITVEDKKAPVIECNDYDLSCTHPNALDEFYSHVDTLYAPAAEMPANIAGGLPGVPSHTFIPINVPCVPMGEVIQNIQVTVNVDHPRTSELSVNLYVPTDLAAAANITNPLVLDLSGNVDDDNTYSPSPSTPDLLQVLGESCALATSTAPEDFITENSGGFPNNLGGTWYIEVIDAGTLLDSGGGLISANAGSITDAYITFTCGFEFPYSAYDCSLQGVNLINEWVAETNCDQSDWNGAQIKRTWQAIDKYGNTSICTQTVNLKAPTMDKIMKPADVYLPCDGTTAADITPEISGGPTFDCNEITQDLHGLCDISYTYDDQVLPTCGNGFKIIRTWTIINCCSNVSKTHVQTILVEDKTGPEIAQENVTVGTDAYSCTADVSLSDLGITDDCAGITSVTATFTQGGGTYQGSGQLIIVDLYSGGTLEGLPVGTSQVLITAKDACLNATEKLITITVVDDTAPIAICDDQLNVSLGGTGEAWIYAHDIDEGSYDNCGDITLEVRRVDGCLGTSNWANSVPLECCDIGTSPGVKVELRVTDASGNSNVCWKYVLVEDALPPSITCPEDKTFTCDDPALHDPLGEATGLDNCGASVTFVDTEVLDNCSAGTITRIFTVTDGSDKSSDVTCSQEITVEHVSDFSVQFPADALLQNCSLEDSGYPIVIDDDCELVAISSDTLIFDLVQDACYKMEITWTVVNWCIYDQANPDNTNLGFPQPLPGAYKDDGDGYFQYVQTVKVLDNEAPIIDCPGDLVFCDAANDAADGCSASIILDITANDACTLDASDLEYTYKIDANNDGSIDITGSGPDASGVYPYGTHHIKWIVEDGCGNSSECGYNFTVQDCKNPTPVCLNGITIPTMNSNGCVDIWANDLLEYAFDNCSADAFVENSVKIKIVGESGSPSDVLTLCCDDLVDGISSFINVEVWVWDEAGNSDYCVTYIGLQDNSDVCQNTTTGGTAAMIAGHIETETGSMVEQVMVDLTGSSTLAYPTGAGGNYSFPGLTMTNNYTVTPGKDINPLNGVTTFDLVLISKHILSTAPLTSPYQLIAADVTNDGNITTFDVVQLRQLILFIITDFPTNTSWRFVDMDYIFPNPQNPWSQAFPESVTYGSLSQSEMATDFIGVKIGDVSGDATPNSLLGSEDRNAVGTLALMVEDTEMTAGESYTVDFRASDFADIAGYQFTLNFDANAMNFAGVEAGALEISDANFGTTMIDEGVITTSFNTNEAISVEDDAVLFSMTFDANTTANLREMLTISSRYTAAEAYNAELDLMEVTLEFNTATGTSTAAAFELYQNRPNPFSDATVISFNLPEAATATLKVYDVSGKILTVVNNEFVRGYNEVTIDRANLNASGVLYYQLETPNNSATMKMILLK